MSTLFKIFFHFFFVFFRGGNFPHSASRGVGSQRHAEWAVSVSRSWQSAPRGVGSQRLAGINTDLSKMSFFCKKNKGLPVLF